MCPACTTNNEEKEDIHCQYSAARAQTLNKTQKMIFWAIWTALLIDFTGREAQLQKYDLVMMSSTWPKSGTKQAALAGFAAGSQYLILHLA